MASPFVGLTGRFGAILVEIVAGLGAVLVEIDIRFTVFARRGVCQLSRIGPGRQPRIANCVLPVKSDHFVCSGRRLMTQDVGSD